MIIEPWLGLSRPVIILKIVDLPTPFGPSKPNIWPWFKLKLMFSKMILFLKDNEILGKRQDLTPIKIQEIAKKFKDAGATILGGCCETSPSHIEAISKIK